MFDVIARCHLESEEGQTMAEYSIVLSVIIISIVVALAALTPAIRNRIEVVIGFLP